MEDQIEKCLSCKKKIRSFKNAVTKWEMGVKRYYHKKCIFEIRENKRLEDLEKYICNH